MGFKLLADRIGLSFAIVLAAGSVAWADVAFEPPEMTTSLPAPKYVVAIGLGMSLVAVMLGLRLVRSEKVSRFALNVVLFLLGVATAATALYSKKQRAEYARQVKEANDSYTGPARDYDLTVGGPKGPGGSSDGPPVIEPPPIDGPGIDPPSIDPPAVDPPAVDPPAVDPPAVDPPSIDPPGVDPPAIDVESNRPE